MISLEKLLKQMAWADAKLFDALSGLPDEAWRSKVAEGEWNVAANTFHLVASADWYCYQLGQKIEFTKEPESIAEIRSLGETWKSKNAFLISESGKADEPLSYVDGEKTRTALRSTILAQAIIHSVEHRIHIALALKAGGFEFPDLEDFSVWGYVYATR